MKNIFLFTLTVVIGIACKKAQILQTISTGESIPWNDTSNKHPKDAAFKALITKYIKKGLPGISLLVSDNKGTWVGALGKADLQSNIDFVPGTISKAASVTKFFIGVLIFRLMEDSATTSLSYSSLNKPISDWIDADIINKLPNGKLITLGQALKHETGIPDLIENDDFYLAVLNDPNKKWTQEELLQFVYHDDPLFAPGDCYDTIKLFSNFFLPCLCCFFILIHILFLVINNCYCS
jgi:D-alanyl-D-alanine carboxypeptidase